MSPRHSFVLASFSLLVTVGACGGDDAATPDAEVADAEVPDAVAPDAGPAADLSCIDTPLPTTATDPIVVDGIASSAGIGGLTPLAGVTVQGLAVAGDAELDNSGGATVADGVYQLSIASGGTPVSGYIKGHTEDTLFRDTYLYPPFPLAASQDTAPLLFLDDSTLGLFPLLTNVTQADDKGLIAVIVLDCAGDPVVGATVTTTPAGTVIYSDGNTPDANATATGTAGLAFIFNVGPGNVEVDATVGGTSFREHTVNARMRTITTTVVAPGPITQ